MENFGGGSFTKSAPQAGAGTELQKRTKSKYYFRHSWMRLLDEPVELLGAGGPIDHHILRTDDDRCGRIGAPDRRIEVCAGLHGESDQTGRDFTAKAEIVFGKKGTGWGTLICTDKL